MAVRPLPAHQLLVSFAEAGQMLGVTAVTIRNLVARGQLTPHPVLADRITRNQIERFALQSELNAETDTSQRRAVDSRLTAINWSST